MKALVKRRSPPLSSQNQDTEAETSSSSLSFLTRHCFIRVFFVIFSTSIPLIITIPQSTSSKCNLCRPIIPLSLGFLDGCLGAMGARGGKWGKRRSLPQGPLRCWRSSLWGCPEREPITFLLIQNPKLYTENRNLQHRHERTKHFTCISGRKALISDRMRQQLSTV
jgi:hypothetical protein